MDISTYDTDVRDLYRRVREGAEAFDASTLVDARSLEHTALATGDRRLLAHALLFKALCLYVGNPGGDDWRDTLVRGMAVQRETGEVEMLGRSYNLLGSDAAVHSDAASGYEYLTEALRCCGSLDTPGTRNLAMVVNHNFGFLYMQVGESGRALECMQRALELGGEGDGTPAEEMAPTLLAIGTLHANLGDWDEAARALRTALDLVGDEGGLELADRPLHCDLTVRIAHSQSDQAALNDCVNRFTRDTEGHAIYVGALTDVCDLVHHLVEMGASYQAHQVIEVMRPSFDRVGIHYLRTRFVAEQIRLARREGGHGDLRRLGDTFFDEVEGLMAEQDRSAVRSMDTRRALEEYRVREEGAQRERAQLVQQAHHDELTGLPNRHLLDSLADRAFERCYHEGQNLAVEILDIDCFKQFNDAYGHQAGDQAIKVVASALMSLAQDNDGVHVARWGGDEFVAVYERRSDEEVLALAEGLRRAVLDLHIPAKASDASLWLTISQGIRNSVPTSSNRMWDYLSVADYALYDVKRAGKNGIRLRHSPHDQG